MYILLLQVCLCLYPKNIRTAKPIQPKLFEGPHMTPEKVYELINVALKNLDFSKSTKKNYYLI